MGSEDSQIILIFISAAAIVALMASLIAVFVVLQQKREIARKQQMQRMESDFQKDLLKAAIEGQERERKRLAKDLHDGIGSLLVGLNMNLKLRKNGAEAGSDQDSFLSDACQIVEEGIAEVRRVSHDLLPATLESFGLVQALEECIEPLQQSDRFSIRFSVRGKATRLEPSTELGLLRVTQELLQNTIRHAGAAGAVIELDFNENAVRLNYKDNGNGLTEKAEAHTGIGIKNMQSRIQALSGTMELRNGHDGGLEARINIPKTQNL